MGLTENNGNTVVTVVIPAYNAANFIEDAVKSCFDQTYRPMETIVVNDGSTDATANKVHALAENLNGSEFELRLIDVDKNMGAANALNLGFSNAKGAYVCWLSADDAFVDKEKVRKQVNRMKKTEADWSYFRDFYIGPNAVTAKLVKSSYLPKLRFLDSFFIRNPDLRLMLLLFRNPVNGSSVMIRKECVTAHGQFDPTMRNIDADGDLWMRYSALKLKLCALKGASVFLREHGGQTSKKKEDMMYGSELTRIRILRMLHRRGKLAKVTRKFAKFFPIILAAKKHLDRPMVSEFLFNYIVENKSQFNYFQVKSAKEALSDVRKHRNYQSIDKNKFADDLAFLEKSEVFAKFEATFEETV
ncbi:MAG: glycosyltransferase [Candidatus Bathyarchaeota archaeon]|nr:glycosyltransferase [Candidatus Bathyarchaeota archaeon]